MKRKERTDAPKDAGSTGGTVVIPGLVPGIQPTAIAGARGTMDPGDKHRDDSAVNW
jgi:hypothetical protein